MADIRTSRIEILKNSHVSGDGETITVIYSTKNGNTQRLEMTPETAGALTGGLRDAARTSSEYRKARGIEPPLEQVWTAERVFASHPTRSKVLLHVHSGGIRQIFELPASEVASVVEDLSTSLRLHAQANPGTDTEPSSGDVIPSTLTLGLLTPPISTAGMTDYPDGLGMEIAMVTDGNTQSRLRLPMFADTARAIIEALQNHLNKMDDLSVTSKPAKPS